jgi:hypothetical protein
MSKKRAPNRLPRARRLIDELRELGVKVFLDEFGVHARPADKIPLPLRGHLRALKPWIAEHLALSGESVIDDPEERSHQGSNTPPAPEMSRDEGFAASLKASRRSYQSGQVNVINHDGLTPPENANSMGRYMYLLRQERERSEAIERGDSPPDGKYSTKFDIFK